MRKRRVVGRNYGTKYIEVKVSPGVTLEARGSLVQRWWTPEDRGTLLKQWWTFQTSQRKLALRHVRNGGECPTAVVKLWGDTENTGTLAAKIVWWHLPQKMLRHNCEHPNQRHVQYWRYDGGGDRTLQQFDKDLVKLWGDAENVGTIAVNIVWC